MAMSPVVGLLVALALRHPLGHRALTLESTDEAGLADWRAQQPPEKLKWLEEVSNKVKEREAARRQRGLQPGQSPADEEPEQAPRGRPVTRNPGDPPNLADLIQAAEEEKLRAPVDAVNHMAVVKAPTVLALTEAYFHQVYCNGNPVDGDTATMLQIIRQGLEQPRGWGSFPTVLLGLSPSDDAPEHNPPNPTVLGTWAGGEIRLRTGRGENLETLSHEVRHHNDGSWQPPMDGQGRLRPTPPGDEAARRAEVKRAAEEYAYAMMTKEFGGPAYVHCQPRPLASPNRS